MGRTQIEKMWLGGAAVLALLIAVVGYFFLVGPQRTQTQDVQGQVADAQLQATSLQSQIITLASEQKKLATYRSALAQAREALPTADDLSATPALLRSLQVIAHESSTTVSSLTVGDPTAVVPVAPTVADTDTSSTTTSTAPVDPTTVSPAASLYSVAITTSVSGTTKNLVAFLERLQHHQPRAVLISGVTIGGATTGSKGGETMSLTMTAFVRPPAVTPTTGSTDPAATPTATSTP